MNKKILMGCTLMLALSFLVTSVYAVPPPLDRLPGQRINIYSGEGTTFYTSNTTHVVHGWQAAGWKNLTRDQKMEFVYTAQFYLFINGHRIHKLKTGLWYDEDADAMYSLRAIVFEPYTFAAGTYSFRGVWYVEVDGVPTGYDTTVTVTVLE